MIFYKHFHDTYNYMVHYGNHAEKRNLIDVFFNQDRGILVILGLIPITFISWYMGISSYPCHLYHIQLLKELGLL